MTAPAYSLKLEAVRRYVQSVPWSIEHRKGAALLEVITTRAVGKKFTRAEIADRLAAAAQGKAQAGPTPLAGKQGAIQVINVMGVVAHRMDLFSEMSGGCSTLRISDEFDAAMNDPNVTAIVFNVDSPGGSIDGVPELAQRIRQARGKGKKLVAVSNTLMASAAYWIGSQCDEVVATPSAAVGSIGVFMVHLDESGFDAQMGLQYSLIYAGKHKVDGNPYEPLSDGARAALQEQVDEFYTLFVNDVAKGRKAKAADVRKGYGEGRCLTASQALEAGLVDRVDTFDNVLARLGAKNVTASGKPRPSPSMGASAEPRTIIVAGATPFLDETNPEHRAAFSEFARAAAGGVPLQIAIVPTDPEDEETDPDEDDLLCPECGAPMDGPRCTQCDYEMPDESAHAQDAHTDASRVAPVVTDSPDNQPAPEAREQIMPPENAAPANGAGHAEAIAAERRRAQEVRAIGAELLTAGVQQATIDRAVNDGLSVEQAQAAFNADIRSRHAANPTIRVGSDRAAEQPFATFGEQIMAIVRAGTPGGSVDPRLKYINSRATQVERQFYAGPSGMNESVGSEGGFFIQPELLPGVIDPVFENDPILSRTFKIPSANVSVKYNVVDETSRANGSRWGGMQIYRAAEAAQATKSKPTLRQMELTKKKLIGLAWLTDELNLDAPAANALLTRGFQSELGFTLANEVFRGNGAGQMLGFLNAGCTVSQAIEGTQTIANSNTFIAINAAKMLASIPPALWGDVIWLYNAELLSTLITATIGGSAGVPIFLGANGLSGRPYDTILGKPAFASELCEAVGTPGDFIAVVPNQFHVLADEGAIMATSLHLRFDYDEMALRITHRSDGAPVWRTSVTKFKGGQKWSPFVTLAARS